MAPRRGQRKKSAAASSEPATSSIPELGGLASQVQDAIADFDQGGRDALVGIIASHLEASSSTLAAFTLSQISLSSIRSTLLVDQLQQVFVAVFEGLPEDVKEEAVDMLGEALVDIVEVLDEESEDCRDLPGYEGGEVEGGSAGDKGLELIKRLTESGHLPPHIPNFLLTAAYSHNPRERMRPTPLLKAGLHPTPDAQENLQRAFVKRNTTLFFKQSKYNLLRESSEGFSGLIVLLTGPDALPPRLDALESDQERMNRAKRVWGKVMALIGYFNLSPPRVLDVILETASHHVAVHWRFFLDLLKCSPWGRAALVAEVGGKGKGKERMVDASWVDVELLGIEEALRADGDRVLGQVLGVKFGFYQKADGGDPIMGLYYLTALLVKHGFVSLSDLLPFLSPDDQEMEAIHRNWLNSINSRSGPSNALANSVLLDEDAPAASTTKDAEAGGSAPKPPPEQRIYLTQALLAIGDLSNSLFLLGKFPWMAQSHVTIADLILRLIGYALGDVYQESMERKYGGQDEEDVEYGEAGPSSFNKVTQEVVPTLLAPQPPSTASKVFEFFYPEWSDGQEKWTSVEDIHDKGLRLLSLVRGVGARSVDVMVKICRIGTTHFAMLRSQKAADLGLTKGAKSREDHNALYPTAEEMRPWLDILRVALLPALSASGGIAAFDVELWHLLSHLPYPVRYSLYGEWRDSTCNPRGRSPCFIATHAAGESTRDIKKALSRVTASQTGGSTTAAADRGPARALAKLSHANPCALWTTAVTQVKAYPNIGQFIVEAGRYMTQLSMDVATFTLVDTLSDDNISRLNANGTDVAQWLSSLATFVGDFNRRYMYMDLEPILQFIINRLMRSESADLTILDKLIAIMSGVSQIENDAISEDQLKAYASGREMMKEAFNSTYIAIAKPADPMAGDARKEAPIDKAKSTKKSLPRFINALRETRLTTPIWIALAQTSQAAADRMAGVPIKAMASMQDTVHSTFIQYGDLMTEQLSSNEHIDLTPELSSLVSEFGLDFAMAFTILRPRINAELEKAATEEKAALQKRLQAEKDSLTQKIMSPVQAASPILPPSPTTAASVFSMMEGDDGDVAMEDIKVEGANGEVSSVPAPRIAKNRTKVYFPSALFRTMEQAKGLLPPDVNSVMSAPFFVIFWHLTMSDIAISTESYQQADDKIANLKKQIADWPLPPNTTANQGARESMKKPRDAEIARLTARAAQLVRERDAMQKTVDTTRRRLQRESSRWFGKGIADKNLQRRLSYQLHQYCFFPRAILTPSDAVYVAKFIRLAHDMGTVAFSTLFAYDNFFSETLAPCIFMATNNEARNFGRCLSAIMADLDAWHRDEALFKREALGLSKDAEADSEKKPLPGMVFRTRTGDEPQPMSWVQFRNFYAKCHTNLTKALVSCWAETDFMHIKNAVTVGMQVIKYYPVMDIDEAAIETAVKKLVADGNLTPDLQHQCQAYLRSLTQRQIARPLLAPATFHSAGVPKKSTTEVPTGPSKVVPVAPRSTAAGTGSSEDKVAGSTKNPSADPKVLRQKLEEAKARGVSTSSVKEELLPTSSAPATAPLLRSQTEPGLTEKDSGRPPSPSPAPAGPRATRSSTALPGVPTGPGGTTKINGSASDSKSAPAGPSLSNLPSRPGNNTSSSMGPPSFSVDEERAAARARKFGTLSKPLAVASNGTTLKQPATATPEPKKESTPAPVSRHASPTSRTRRSQSAESHKTDQSRRDREPRNGDRGNDAATANRAPEGTSRTNGAQDDRRKQEDLLQARHDRLASGEERGTEHRRSSRDDRRRETEKEREERKAREREERKGTDKDRDRDKEREKTGEDGSGSKRKRDEAPRRIDDPRDRDRDKDRPSDREGRRKGHRDDDRRGAEHRVRDVRDAPDSFRDDRRERDGLRDDREDRRDDRRSGRAGSKEDRRGDPRDDRDRRHRDRSGPVVEPTREARRHSPEKAIRPRSPEMRDARKRSTVPEATGGNRTPKSEATSKESLPLRPDARAINGQTDRIIEPPRPTRSSEANRLPSNPTKPPEVANGSNAARGPHGLPPRPNATNIQPAQATSTVGSLAARMGPPASLPPPVVAESRSPAPPRERSPDGSSVTEDRLSDPRKRPLESETITPPREESPGASKRVKIDRVRAQRHDRQGREASSTAGNRLLASAMKLAAPEK